MHQIIRNIYLDQLNLMVEKNIITLLVGLRRVGKSTIMKQFMEQKELVKKNILYLPLEQFAYLFLRKKEDLIDFFQQHNLDTLDHLLIDEIQLVQWWEEVINGIHTSFPKLNIILTGSNSNLLSTEIATGLRGRVYQLYVYPFDLAEYSERIQQPQNHDTLIDLLLKTGLPFVNQYENPSYIMYELINTVFLKDIVERYTIRDVELLRSVFLFLISNCANITNLTKIAEFLTARWFTVNVNTIGNYVEYLKHSLLIHECPLYDIQGKKVFDKLRKFYLADHWIRNYLLFPIRSRDRKTVRKLYLPPTHQTSLSGLHLTYQYAGNRFYCRKRREKDLSSNSSIPR